jgi:glycosyltransferase involved in cell wall biosynthesis
MISVVTITYQRHHILEEAINSFLLQDYNGSSEMIVVNDSPLVEYKFDHPNVRVINIKDRFLSITKKLEWAMKEAKGDYLYRLDDDDLLAPWALSSVIEDTVTHPGYDIYRSKQQYYFVDNKFNKIASNVNNGNVYSKEFINRITFPGEKSGEDAKLTFHLGGSIYEPSNKKPTMLYRWGMNTYHISGTGIKSNIEVQKQTDRLLKSKEQGVIQLKPHFKVDYYSQLPK